VWPAWDNHATNAERLKTTLTPPMDLAGSALPEDLQQRGMLDETLVDWTGEFGRSPKHAAVGGRDHRGRVAASACARFSAAVSLESLFSGPAGKYWTSSVK
jgi:hypothetical protein